jgi:hypothetical protein
MTRFATCITRFTAACGIAAAMAVVPAQAAFVPSVTATAGEPGFIDFAVRLDEPHPVVTMDLMMMLPEGVFGPLPGEGTPLAATSSRGGAWEITAFWPTISGGVSLLGVITAIPVAPDFLFEPITFGPGENVFFFSLPLLATAQGAHDFAFVAGFDEDVANAVTGGGTIEIPGAVIPEPSTYALVLGGLLAFGAIARRRTRHSA